VYKIYIYISTCVYMYACICFESACCFQTCCASWMFDLSETICLFDGSALFKLRIGVFACFSAFFVSACHGGVFLFVLECVNCWMLTFPFGPLKFWCPLACWIVKNFESNQEFWACRVFYFSNLHVFDSPYHFDGFAR
jgi:hypothetical protein